MNSILTAVINFAGRRGRDFRMLGSVKVESDTQGTDGPTPASPLVSGIRLWETLDTGCLPIFPKKWPQLGLKQA
jgi:hypothetical protein